MTSYYRFSKYLRERYGCRVHKITVDAGFGCPNIDGTLNRNGCIFCDNFAFSPAVRKKGVSIEQQIEEGIARGKKRYSAKKFMVYFQPYSNTYAPVKVLQARYNTIKTFPEVVGISIGTRPDCIDNDKISLIETYTKDYEVWMEYGLQSVHDKTLKAVNRNHTYGDFIRAVEITRNRGIKICAHVIIGLPGETSEDMFETAKECSRLNLDGIKLHPLHVVKGTTLEKMFNEGQYKPFGMEDYIRITSEFLAHLNPGMVIQRLTADCPKDILAAPEWINQKQQILKLLEATMLRKGLSQGSSNKQL